MIFIAFNAMANPDSLKVTTIMDETTFTSENLIPNWLRILGRDLAGALAGAATGAGAGALIGGPAGAGAGAVIGGVMGGAAASIDAAGMVAPNDPSTLGGLANPNNPYDDAGLMHYTGMDNIYANPTGIISLPGSLNTGNYYPRIRQTIIQNGLATASEIDQYYLYPTFVNDFNSTKALDFSPLLAQLVSQSKITQGDANFLTSYYVALENSSDYQAFKNYSIQNENEVLNSSNFSEKSKAILLTFMATARYGAAYWQIK